MAKGHQPVMQTAPTSSTPPNQGSSGKPPTIETVRLPHLASAVVVTTPERISGQNEHAAIVTRVHAADLVSVMAFPADGQPFPIKEIRFGTALGWRWPTRT